MCSPTTSAFNSKDKQVNYKPVPYVILSSFILLTKQYTLQVFVELKTNNCWLSEGKLGENLKT